MNIFEIDSNGYFTGNIREVDELHGAPLGWVIDTPPEVEDGKVAQWVGEWVLTEYVEPAPVVPQEVSRRRGLQALFLMYGITESDVEKAINENITDSAAVYLALTEFRSSQVFERQRALVITMGQILNLDLDKLFIKAALIE